MKLTIQVEKFLQSIFYLSFNLMTLMHVNMRLILTNIIDHTFSKRLIFKTLSNQMEIAYCDFKLLYASNYETITKYFCLYHIVLHLFTQHPW